MNKKMGICTLLLGINALCQDIKIVKCEPTHRNQVLDIIFQNPDRFFIDYDKACSESSKEDTDRLLKLHVELFYFKDIHKINKVAIDRNKVVGFVSYWRKKDFLTRLVSTEYVKIEGLAVSQEYRRRGIGKSLIKHVFGYTKELWPDIETIKLDVPPTNHHAMRFYESLGFALSPEQDPECNGVIYECPLHSGTACHCAIL